jgi:predicted HNH restriction endonuclease
LGVHARLINVTLDDLVTVCPNCHTMLHHMSGSRSDVTRLRRIINGRHHRRSKA